MYIYIHLIHTYIYIYIYIYVIYRDTYVFTHDTDRKRMPVASQVPRALLRTSGSSAGNIRSCPWHCHSCSWHADFMGTFHGKTVGKYLGKYEIYSNII